MEKVIETLGTIGTLSLAAVVPLIASIIFALLLKVKAIKNLNYWAKQVIIGIVFGGLAVLGTEYGIPMNGAVMNARDAAPMCAALIFGGPAGIIAGIIGGVERWYAVLWGAGAYTRIACSVSTAVVGLFCAVLKKYMFDNKLPGAQHALAVGTVGEVFHMVMVFVTNMSDVKKAFTVVQACSIPMITTNAVAVFLAVLAANIIDKEDNYFKFKEKATLTQQFQRGLIILIAGAFIVTSTFIVVLQSGLAKNNTEELCTLNIDDIVNEVNNQSDVRLLTITENIIRDLDNIEPDNDEVLVELSNKYNVKEISYVNKYNFIKYSNIPEYKNFDMSSGEQAIEFICLLRGTDKYVQAYGPTTNDGNVYRKYAGIVLGDGYLQVGYDAEQFTEELEKEIKNVVTYRRIGETGGLIVSDADGNIVSNSFGLTESKIDQVKYNVDVNSETYKVLECTDNSEDYYYMRATAEGYNIFAIQPAEEADYSMTISVYLNLFLLTLVFASLFVQLFFMIRSRIVKGVTSVNNALKEITNGNLETVVDVNNNQEFESLSSGINATVDSMKKLIEEANKRIDDELQYAKDIQFSSLPSIFPAFPDRNEFDIFASMDPAKEVGGDFYDFYLLEGKTLAFLVADVAGKGIPAALFMMRSKSILKTYAEAGINVADIFTNANFNLCEGNDAGMFLTAWMGFLNLETGELKYANAGHNKPLIRRANGDYEYLQGPAGFILAGMEGIVYKEQTTTLQPGDEIFLYTDGVPEATNINKELFNDDRLKDTINKYKDYDAQNMSQLIKMEVDNFYKGAPQFDDITMLSLKFKKYFGAE